MADFNEISRLRQGGGGGGGGERELKYGRGHDVVGIAGVTDVKGIGKFYYS